jgi:SAM-dependent methyltransferase
MVFEPELAKLHKLTGPFGRSESVSSASVTSLGGGGGGGSTTMASPASKPSSSHSDGYATTAAAAAAASAIEVRNGRAYLSDPSNMYPLPVDLEEMHRQSLHLMLAIQVLGSPLMAFDDMDRPPRRILEIGCGSGLWSAMCHRHLKAKGIDDVAFVGLDVAPLAPTSLGSGGPDPSMNWRFVQHDIHDHPLPFADEEFDHIQISNMCLTTVDEMHQSLMEQYGRILRPGGTMELWESDTTVRMLRMHVQEQQPQTDSTTDDEEEGEEENKEDRGAENGTANGARTHSSHRNHPQRRRRGNRGPRNLLPPMGVYNITPSTPFSAPCNQYLVEYNGWIVRALDSRRLTAVPCTLMNAMLLQQSDMLRDVRSRRVAVPFSSVRWEREGVGGVITKDGKSYVDWHGGRGGAMQGRQNGGSAMGNGSGAASSGGDEGGLTPAHLAIRRTALLNMIGLIRSLEPLLREISGKRQDEWDAWYGKMTNDLLRPGGTGTVWGECMELGAWWCKKRTET